MASYLKKAKELSARFSVCDLQHISKSKNAQADRLAKLTTLQIEDLDLQVHVETIGTRGTEELDSTLSIELEPSWMNPIFNYLSIGVLPEDKSAFGQ